MNDTDATPLRAQPLRYADIGRALRIGQARLRAIPAVSAAYAALFATLGVIVLTGLGALGMSPLALPLAGGFMLLGPVLLTGYFELATRSERGESPRLADALRAFREAPPALWLVALICAFLFLIWITDAGVLYSFTLGGAHLPYDLGWLPERGADVLSFALWGSLMGSALAYMIYVVSAFSVPLIYERRAGFVQAVGASARTVLGNFGVCLLWGCVLGAVIVASILLLPVLLVTLPWLSFASFALYRTAFPTAPSGMGDASA